MAYGFACKLWGPGAVGATNMSICGACWPPLRRRGDLQKTSRVRERFFQTYQKAKSMYDFELYAIGGRRAQLQVTII